MAQTYKAKNGQTLWKPSIEECTEMDAHNEGFCLACANVQSGVEPDAVRYICDECAAPMVFGAAELALRGLTY